MVVDDLPFFTPIMSSIASQIRELHGLDDTHRYTVTSMISAVMDFQKTEDWNDVSRFMCRTLASITIPAYASYIGDYAFAGCGHLSKISKANGLDYGIHAFDGCDASAVPTVYDSEVSGVYDKGTAAGTRIPNGTNQGLLIDPAVNTAIRTASYNTAHKQFSGLANAMRAMIPQIATYQLSLKAISGYISWITPGDHNNIVAKLIDRTVDSLILSSNMYDGTLSAYTLMSCSNLSTLKLCRPTYITGSSLIGCHQNLHIYTMDSTTIDDEALDYDVTNSSGAWFTFCGRSSDSSCYYTRNYTTGYTSDGYYETSTASFLMSSGRDSMIRYGCNQDGYAPGGQYSTEGTQGYGIHALDFVNASFVADKAFANITQRDRMDLRWLDLSGIYFVDHQAFAGNEKLSDITFPVNYLQINTEAFLDTGVMFLDLSATTELIGSGVFANCSKLYSATINTFVTSMPASTFVDCTGLYSATITGYVKIIGAHMFENCSKLRNVSLPDSVSRIEQGAFDGCTSLTTINYPTGLTVIGPDAFYACEKLSGTANFNSTNLQSIYQDVFRAAKVSRVILPSTMQFIDSRAFRRMPSNTKISCYFPKSVISDQDGYHLDDIDPDTQLVFMT